MTGATCLFLAAICGRGDAYARLQLACCHKRVIDSRFYRAELETDKKFDSAARAYAARRRFRRDVARNLVNPAFMHNIRTYVASGSTASVCLRAGIIIAVVVAPREDPHPITGIVPASTSHRSIALNAASSCSDEADAHSRHSTHSDRRTHCLQSHVSYSASNPMRSIISNLPCRADIFIFSIQPAALNFFSVVTSISDKVLSLVRFIYKCIFFFNNIFLTLRGHTGWQLSRRKFKTRHF